MITPVFEVNQDHTFVYIIINAPYSKVSDADVYIDENDFKFYAKPYFLRLTLPGALIQDDKASCQYDVDNGKYKLKIAKQNHGENFEDLDMLTKLLAPSGGCKVVQPLIEVLDGDEAVLEQYDDFDWTFPQSCPEEVTDSIVLEKNGYGFANQKSGIFGKLQEDLHDVVQMKNLEHSTLEMRNIEKLEFENSKFDPEHYLADFFEEEEILRLIKLKPLWKSSSETVQFTDDEKVALKNLPNREYLLEKHELQTVYLGLTDILFSYAYNWRCTEGENGTESAWNIRTMSATLSWCTRCETVKETVVSAYRRALIFPFYRNWKLAKTCQKDVVGILVQGRKFILKCLLEIRGIFSKCDPYHVTNDLYIQDYCIWIQKASDSAIESLSKSLRDCKLEKTDVLLDLDELEEIGRDVIDEEAASTACDEAAGELATAVAGLKL